MSAASPPPGDAAPGWPGPALAGLPAGLMQEMPLTLDLVLRRLESVGAQVPVISALGGGDVVRHSWGEIAGRSRRLIGVLAKLGLEPGARVATLAWNSHRHLELFYAVPCGGRVLHTLNARVSPATLVEQLEHCGDGALFLDASLSGLLAPYRERLPQVVVLEDGGEIAPEFASAPRYEELLQAADAVSELGPMSEAQALCICHTSGTTGAARAVVYSHRSVVLHALGALSIDFHGVSRADVVMPLTPMFHLMAWGLPYSSALAPAALVLAGPDNSPEALASLIESQRVTLAAGVPTFWVRLAEALEDPSRDLSSLRRVLSGGSAAPRALADRYAAAGIEYVSSWGMTEAGSGTTQRPGPSPPGAAVGATLRQGAAIAGVELRIVDPQGHELPWDDTAVGELQVRGPWVCRSYLDDEGADALAFDGDWLRTGDVARIDPAGSVEIVDRLKDLVKSGGEWISSTELEGHLARQPGVGEAAVIAVPDERWGERPLAALVARAGERIDSDAVRAALEGAVPRWWIPERIELLQELPRTSVGKVDKRRLRERFGGG
ncbi:MAG TPA: AMP-binding protein [Solirubrobacteraceae bacterium]|jgi:fatty-acyl-CoA synthase